jgi:hypothetical protein
VRSTFSRALAGALLSLAVCAPAALGASQTATLGPVTATLSYRAVGFGQLADVRLTIARNGQQLLDQDLQKLCQRCAGAGPVVGGTSIHVENLDGAVNPEPEVYVDLSTGGTHCCNIAQFFRLSDDGTHYEALVHYFASAGYRFADIDHDGAPNIVTRDGAFYERFTPFVASGAPVQILQYDRGTLRDLTRGFPSRVRADLRVWRRVISQQRRRRDGELRGVVAPYVADECLLGRCATGLRFAERLARQGYFSGRRALFGKHGTAYVRALKRLLARRHY